MRQCVTHKTQVHSTKVKVTLRCQKSKNGVCFSCSVDNFIIPWWILKLLCRIVYHHATMYPLKTQVQGSEGKIILSSQSGPATFFRWDWSWNLFYGHSLPSADSRREVVRYLRKDVHWVLVNRLIGLNMPRKSVVRLTDRPNMTLAVDRGR